MADKKSKEKTIKDLARDVLSSESFILVGANEIESNRGYYGDAVHSKSKKVMGDIFDSDSYKKLEKSLFDEKLKQYTKGGFKLGIPSINSTDVLEAMYRQAIELQPYTNLGDLEKVITKNVGDLGVKIPDSLKEVSYIDLMEKSGAIIKDKDEKIQGIDPNKIDEKKLSEDEKKGLIAYKVLSEGYASAGAKKIAEGTDYMEKTKYELKSLFGEPSSQ